MGQPAARIGDSVLHLLPPVLFPGKGSTNVLIGGAPAWRALSAEQVAKLLNAIKDAE